MGLRSILIAGLAAAAPASAAPAHDPARDLDGIWTNGWYTMLERPKELKALVITPGEAEAFEKPRRGLAGMLPSKPDEVGQVESEFGDKGPGLARIRGEIRSSWIVDPPDGKAPWTPEAKARLSIGKEPVERFDNVEERPTDERCLTATGANAPILNSPDTNYVQIVQTPGEVAIVSEKNHDLRVVRLDGPRDPHEPRRWRGTSIGHWEGASLVVETTGLRVGDTRIGRGLFLTDKARVVERFTRTGPRELTYAFEVEDPSLFTRPWRGEEVFRPGEGQIFEFACHEGNYSLPSILAAARQAEADAQTKMVQASR